MAQRIIVVRHGEREDFVDGTWTRRTKRPQDPPLTSSGKQMAKCLGVYLRELHSVPIENPATNVVIFTSPLTRCVQTAHCIAEELLGGKKNRKALQQQVAAAATMASAPLETTGTVGAAAAASKKNNSYSTTTTTCTEGGGTANGKRSPGRQKSGGKTPPPQASTTTTTTTTGITTSNSANGIIIPIYIEESLVEGMRWINGDLRRRPDLASDPSPTNGHGPLWYDSNHHFAHTSPLVVDSASSPHSTPFETVKPFRHNDAPDRYIEKMETGKRCAKAAAAMLQDKSLAGKTVILVGHGETTNAWFNGLVSSSKFQTDYHPDYTGFAELHRHPTNGTYFPYGHIFGQPHLEMEIPGVGAPSDQEVEEGEDHGTTEEEGEEKKSTTTTTTTAATTQQGANSATAGSLSSTASGEKKQGQKEESGEEVPSKDNPWLEKE